MTYETKTINLKNGDAVTVKTNLTIEEKRNLINTVLEAVYKNYTHPDYLALDVAFKVEFLKAVLDGEFVYETEQEAYDAFKVTEFLDAYSENSQLYYELEDLIDRQIYFENAKLLAMYGRDTAKDDMIDSISGVFYVGQKLLEKLGAKIEDGLSSESLAKIMEQFQAIINTGANEDDSDANNAGSKSHIQMWRREQEN